MEEDRLILRPGLPFVRHRSTPAPSPRHAPAWLLRLATVLAVAASAVAADVQPPASTTTAQAPPKKEAKKGKPDTADDFFTNGPVPRLHIELSSEDLNKLRQDGRRYVTATVREEAAGEGHPEAVYEKVGVHLKGAAGSFRAVDDKPGLTLNFGKFSPSPGRQFHGLTKLHLNNSVQDPSYMSENLGNAIFRDAGIPAARVTNARVWINGRDAGLFVLKEGFDDVFLKRFFAAPRGTLYEGSFRDVDADLPERVNKGKTDRALLKELAAAAREGDPDRRRQRLAKVLDADRFLTFMALEAMTAHWDGYCPNRNNYRVYHDGPSDRLVFLPHGTDQLFQNAGYPLMHGNTLVARALSNHPDDKARYLERVAELRQKLFTPELLTRRLDEISARLLPTMEAISADAARQHRRQTETFRQRIVERVRSIDQQLAVTPRPLKFDPAGLAALSGAKWEPQQAGGKVTLDRPEEAGRPRLHIRAASGGGEGTASYRTTVLLPRGRYTFEGPCRTAGVTAPAGTNTGAGLRISGGRREGGVTGDADWQTVRFDFEVAEDARNVVLVCELKATAGDAWFDPEGLKLRRR